MANLCYFKCVKDSEKVFHCISDFILPVESGKVDYIGSFACTVLGVDELCKKFEKDHDDYRYDCLKRPLKSINPVF